MPIYDYRCTSCGHEVEVVHGIDGTGPSTCDLCGGTMRKALSAPAIHFKGSGWAKKDARAASKAPAGGSAAKAKEDHADVAAKSEGGDHGPTAKPSGSTSDNGGSSTSKTSAGAPAAATTGSSRD